MNMKATELQKALESSITCCQPSAYWKSHMVRQIVKGEKITKRTKLSTGVILAAVFVLLSAVLGIFRFRYALSRIHAAALVDTLGILLTLAGLM